MTVPLGVIVVGEHVFCFEQEVDISKGFVFKRNHLTVKNGYLTNEIARMDDLYMSNGMDMFDFKNCRKHAGGVLVDFHTPDIPALFFYIDKATGKLVQKKIVTKLFQNSLSVSSIKYATHKKQIQDSFEICIYDMDTQKEVKRIKIPDCAKGSYYRPIYSIVHPKTGDLYFTLATRDAQDKVYLNKLFVCRWGRTEVEEIDTYYKGGMSDGHLLCWLSENVLCFYSSQLIWKYDISVRTGIPKRKIINISLWDIGDSGNLSFVNERFCDIILPRQREDPHRIIDTLIEKKHEIKSPWTGMHEIVLAYSVERDVFYCFRYADANRTSGAYFIQFGSPGFSVGHVILYREPRIELSIDGVICVHDGMSGITQSVQSADIPSFESPDSMKLGGDVYKISDAERWRDAFEDMKEFTETIFRLAFLGKRYYFSPGNFIWKKKKKRLSKSFALMQMIEIKKRKRHARGLNRDLFMIIADYISKSF